MASSTGIPQEHPARIVAAAEGSREDEPLLGRPGDMSQKDNEHLVKNLSTGTAAIAQAGVLILVALVWAAVFSNKLIFFSPHPLLNSAGVLLTTQAILILQPTHTQSQKEYGALTHFGIIVTSNLAFISGLIIIEINKSSHPGSHFKSPHAILGLITYISIALQAAVGVAQYFFPKLVFGSVERGKRVYKWHRLSGYLVLLLELATIAAATKTDYNVNVLRIKLWAVLIAAALVIVGISARTKKRKLGFS